jgi:Uma2 family endonuclease
MAFETRQEGGFDMSSTLTRHRFTVAQYEEMVDAGILTENDHVELVRGEVVEKMPIGPAHSACVKRLNRLFQQRIGTAAIVAVQDPIRTSDSEPEPDLALLRPRDDFYSEATPGIDDVLLVVEVSDSTLENDRTLKCEIYAEAGIPEYWIVNLVENCLEVHRDPLPSGSYATVQRLDRLSSLAPLNFAECSLSVSELL